PGDSTFSLTNTSFSFVQETHLSGVSNTGLGIGSWVETPIGAISPANAARNLSSGAINLAANGTLTLGITSSGTVGAINGSNVSLVKNGPGSLTLSAPASYTGLTTVKAGVLLVNAA